MVLLLSPKYTSSKFSGFLVALKNEMPCFRAFPAVCNYSSSSMATTCSATRFAVLQDVGIILSGIERNNHIFCGFLSLNYPWDNKHTDAFSVPSELFKWIQIVLFHISDIAKEFKFRR